MIITENILRDMVAQMPEIVLQRDELGNPVISRKPVFHWGDRHELVKFLALKKDDAYPLVWLMLGKDKYVSNENIVDRECVFILATRETRKDLLYSERYALSYDIVLNPLLNYLLQGLRNSDVTNILDDEVMVERHPDYTESYYKNDNDNFTIDLWDAIRVTVDVEFNKNCLKEISWQTI